MKVRRWWAVAACLVLGVGGMALVLALPGATVGASALSKGPLGLWTAARYLVVRGTGVERRYATLGEQRPGAALLVAFPATGAYADVELVALRRHLADGGSLVLAYSGRAPGWPEEQIAMEVGLELREIRPNPHLWPVSWWHFEGADWQVHGESGAFTLRAPQVLPVREGEQTVLLRGPGGEVVGFSFTLRRGRVFVVPAEALANCRLAQAGALGMLEGLRRDLPGSWEVDEWRHGLRQPVRGVRWTGSLAFDLLLLQIGLVYVLTVVALGRRFGPVWRERVVAAGSVASFLVALGRLHRSLGHFDEAARLLVERAGELEPAVARRLTGVVGRANSGPELLRVATEVAIAQRWRASEGGMRDE